MSNSLYEPPRSDGASVTIPTIRIAFALSLLIHAAVLWLWVPRELDPMSARAERGKASGSLAVRLAPPPSPAASAPSATPAPPPPPPSAQRTPPPPSAPRPAPVPPVIAKKEPAPVPPVIAKKEPAPAVATAPVPPSATAPAPTPVEGDFSSYLEARRRARGAAAEDSTSSTTPVEDGRARHGGGVFQVDRVGYTSAEFTFFGWNKDIQRRATQLIEVQKGDNSDIRIAVVRRMIAIIRQHESGDFVWVSPRLGRELTLSARLSDNAGLEDFLLKEFFAEAR